MNFDKMSKCELYYQIECISFAMDDMRLFLDTHPYESEAIEYMKYLMKLRHEALRIYSMKYDPIYSYNFKIDDCWNWNEAPMPWHMGGR